MKIISNLQEDKLRPKLNHSEINSISIIIDKVKKICDQVKLGSVCFKDFKNNFDYVCQVKLVQQMIDLGNDRDIVR